MKGTLMFMNFIKHIHSEGSVVNSLNDFIYKGTERYEYHMNHIHLTRSYALLLNKKLRSSVSPKKLEYISLAHDTFKKVPGDDKSPLVWKGHTLPVDSNIYIRSNMETLETYNMDEHFNSIENHPVVAAIFIAKELGITDPEIIYPIMFHSCPIISIYKTLSETIQNTIDIIMLADKLSSNYLKINMRETKVRLDLDRLVFGKDKNEFNYSLGLFVARLLGHEDSINYESMISTDHYYMRLTEVNKLIQKKYSLKSFGDYMKWPKRPGVIPTSGIGVKLLHRNRKDDKHVKEES